MGPIPYRTPDELKALVAREEKELNSFFSKLRQKPPKNLDETFQSLHDKAFEQFSCLDCANCCKSISPIVTDKDIERLAKKFRIRPAELIGHHLHLDEENDYVFNQTPCPFLLSDHYCSVYEDRPKACREYPHTDHRKMHTILSLTLKNCTICPVVYEIIKELRTK